MGWGFGVGVKTTGPQRGRYGWSGGQGTDFFVDPEGTIGILLTQVELGERVWPLVEEFQALKRPPDSSPKVCGVLKRLGPMSRPPEVVLGEFAALAVSVETHHKAVVIDANDWTVGRSR